MPYLFCPLFSWNSTVVECIIGKIEKGDNEFMYYNISTKFLGYALLNESQTEIFMKLIEKTKYDSPSDELAQYDLNSDIDKFFSFLLNYDSEFRNYEHIDELYLKTFYK